MLPGPERLPMSFLLPPFCAPDFAAPSLAAAPPARFLPAPAAGVAPEVFHATTIYPEYFQLAPGDWHLAGETRMDCVVVCQPDGTLAVREFRHLRKGELVAVGRSDTGEEGIYVHNSPFADAAAKSDQALSPPVPLQWADPVKQSGISETGAEASRSSRFAGRLSEPGPGASWRSASGGAQYFARSTHAKYTISSNILQSISVVVSVPASRLHSSLRHFRRRVAELVASICRKYKLGRFREEDLRSKNEPPPTVALQPWLPFQP